MSCNYADGLSPYEDKGVLGIPEKFDSEDELHRKCEQLADLISQSKHVVVHTGAGISTSAGIPDFRGPNGVWTLEKEGKKPTTDVSFGNALPTKTHMILKKLVECNKIHYVVSQNIDGLHLKSGLPRQYLSELHGNMYVDECNMCKRQFVRQSPSKTVGKKATGESCKSNRITGRPCRGKMYDTILDWEHALPENDLNLSELHSSVADLSICLGTTLQIVPSGNLPLETLKYGGKLVICNLQPTKHNNKADLIISYYVDEILERVIKRLGVEAPEYCEAENPSKNTRNVIEWTLYRYYVKDMEKVFDKKCTGIEKKRKLVRKNETLDFLQLDVKLNTCKKTCIKHPTDVKDNNIVVSNEKKE